MIGSADCSATFTPARTSSTSTWSKRAQGSPSSATIRNSGCSRQLVIAPGWPASGCGRDSVCGPVGFGDVEILEVESDPAGDDNDRPNAKFVALRNAGADTADLSGWILRDESSSNRLEIPNGLLLQAGAVLTIRSGCGTDSDTELFWCSGPIWSNGGDTVILQAPNGSVVDAVSYR